MINQIKIIGITTQVITAISIGYLLLSLHHRYNMAIGINIALLSVLLYVSYRMISKISNRTDLRLGLAVGSYLGILINIVLLYVVLPVMLIHTSLWVYTAAVAVVGLVSIYQLWSNKSVEDNDSNITRDIFRDM